MLALCTIYIINFFNLNSMQFFCGDSFNFNPSYYNETLEISSAETNQFCFYDDSGVEIKNSSYTRKISGDSLLLTPIQAIVNYFIVF